MLDSSSGRHRRRAKVEHGTEPNESSGGSSMSASRYAHDGHGTTNPTRAPPQYDDIPRPSANRSPTACLEVIGQAPAIVVCSSDTNPVYFYTESYPFAVEQFDKRKEDEWGMAPAQLPSGGADVPILNADNCKQLKLGGEVPAAISLRGWDESCLEKHLGAIARSIATPEELNDFVLMKDETPQHFLRLAGISDAPGLHEDVAQRCRMAFTNKDRLIFTQDKHSADVGIPIMNCCSSFLPCLLDKWSRRTWTSYYASVHASDILQVFVQQTLTTNYHSFGCAYHDICSEFCIVGGSLQTDKDIEGAIQTMGDHDPDGFVMKHDKTRRMRHALVVRYVDCATNSVRQTVALAHPDTPASELYEMARSIEEKITLRSADWFKFKSTPTPLAANAFRDLAGMTPFLKRRSYKIGMFLLLIVALSILAVNVAAALAMIFSVLFSFGSSYYSLAKTAKTGTSTGRTLLASQGLAGLIYVISLLVVISQSTTSSSSSAGSSSYNYGYP